LDRNIWDLRNEQKMMMMRWGIFVISTMSCKKILGTRNVERRVVL